MHRKPVAKCRDARHLSVMLSHQRQAERERADDRGVGNMRCCCCCCYCCRRRRCGGGAANYIAQAIIAHAAVVESGVKYHVTVWLGGGVQTTRNGSFCTHGLSKMKAETQRCTEFVHIYFDCTFLASCKKSRHASSTGHVTPETVTATKSASKWALGRCNWHVHSSAAEGEGGDDMAPGDRSQMLTLDPASADTRMTGG
jgi:hypothetical protein